MSAPRVFDRVKDTTATAGTGAITLANSAPSGYQTYATAGAANGDYVRYCIAAQSGGLFEVGYGVYNSSGPTLTRVATQVESGSSGIGVLVNFSAGTSDVFCPDSALSQSGNIIYGDFSSGVLTFDGTSVVAGLTPSSNTYTLTGHLYGTIITINSGVTIKWGGYIIFGLLLINNGTIHANGGDASGGTLGATQWGATLPLPGGVSGLVGKTIAGNGGQPSALTVTYGGAGGAGGADGQGHTGASGGVNGPNASVGAIRHYPFVLYGSTITRNSGSLQQGNAGNGGGSGAFNTGTSSGAGGAGGGYGTICCKIIINNGTISSNGGNGGNATGSGDAGGGGGGGGGVICCVYNQYVGTNPVCLASVSGGTKIGLGSNGSLGNAGTIFLLSNS